MCVFVKAFRGTFGGFNHKPGYSSIYGFGIVIYLENGLIFDYKWFSLYWHISLEIILDDIMILYYKINKHSITLWKLILSYSCNKAAMVSEEIETWYILHINDCNINFDGAQM